MYFTSSYIQMYLIEFVDMRLDVQLNSVSTDISVLRNNPSRILGGLRVFILQTEMAVFYFVV
jgi:hypothetical protein